ncbi:unnamed protein product [Eruca vesicaria subsp. sativa]|uniref:Uncharacterized protein n=1 Tax=Eruca vesicaria subsp. sativa TaxID=29727 RepID=A0ABC8LPI9_ERUVS|nr:unnamed protein product [Eruca vesicaria subsp. sativa]
MDLANELKNWTGSGKVSYQDIISLESHFDKAELFPFISSAGKLGVIDDPEFIREDEKKDERVDRIVGIIKANHDWKQFIWKVEPLPTNMVFSNSEDDVEVEDVTPVVVEKPTVAAKRAKHKLNDPGVESRKRELLCQRAAEHNTGVSGEMKTFIVDLFTSFKEVVRKDIQDHFDKVDIEVAHIKEKVSQIMGPSDTVAKAAKSVDPSVPLAKDQDKSS